MYTAIPLSLRAGQQGSINVSYADEESRGTLTAGIFVTDYERVDLDCSGDKIRIPGMGVGLHLIEVRVKGRTVIYQHVEVQPTPLGEPTPDTMTWNANIPADTMTPVVLATPTGPQGEKGEKGDKGDSFALDIVETEANDGNATNRGIRLDGSHVPVGRLHEVRLTCRSTIGAGFNGDSAPVYLTIWEQSADGGSYSIVGTSTEPAVQQISHTTHWFFEDAGELHGREILLLAHTSPQPPSADWDPAQGELLGMRVKAYSGTADSSCLYNSLSEYYSFIPAITIVAIPASIVSLVASTGSSSKNLTPLLESLYSQEVITPSAPSTSAYRSTLYAELRVDGGHYATPCLLRTLRLYPHATPTPSQLYLTVWEERNGAWDFLACSQKTTLTAGAQADFVFDPPVPLTGTAIRIGCLLTASPQWPQDNGFVPVDWYVFDSDLSDESWLQGADNGQYYLYPRHSIIHSDALLDAHKADNTAHLAEEEHKKLTAHLADNVAHLSTEEHQKLTSLLASGSSSGGGSTGGGSSSVPATKQAQAVSWKPGTTATEVGEAYPHTGLATRGAIVQLTDELRNSGLRQFEVVFEYAPATDSEQLKQALQSLYYIPLFGTSYDMQKPSYGSTFLPYKLSGVKMRGGDALYTASELVVTGTKISVPVVIPPDADRNKNARNFVGFYLSSDSQLYLEGQWDQGSLTDLPLVPYNLLSSTEVFGVNSYSNNFSEQYGPKAYLPQVVQSVAKKASLIYLTEEQQALLSDLLGSKVTI